MRLTDAGETKVDLQTIVTTEEDTPCVNSPTASPTDGNESIYAAWNNHFSAFGGKLLDKIMEDYTEESIVQVFDNKDKTYNAYTGLAAIRGMFDDLFKAIAAGAVGGDEGVQVGLLEIDVKYNSVFLVWQSNSHPKATDTFIFYEVDGVSKIARQNIVVETKAGLVS